LTLSVIILALVTLERLGELVYARANARRLLAQGGVEHGAGHYPLIVALHAGWLIALWLFAPGRTVAGFWLGMFVLVILARFWVLASLGRRWTTRIVTVPGETLIRRGPYRFLNHPNYWVVVAEIAVLPLVFGLWQVALIFSLFNGAMMWVRIGAENKALRGFSRG
jgi:methyltransferase